MLTTHRFLLKSCAAMVGTLMLSACQSSMTNHQSQGVITDSAKALFDNSQQSPAYQAKQDFIKALKAHLYSERYAVSQYYYQASPIYQPDSIDYDADSVWASISKTNEYRKNQLNHDYQDNAFLSAIDYLYPQDDQLGMGMDLGELPYLRYDDEKSENPPQDTVSRSVGMSETYQDLNYDIQQLSTEADDCARATSGEIDYLLTTDNNPNIDSTNPDIQAIQTTLSSCEQLIEHKADALLKEAQGYQKDDIKHITSCLAYYSRGLKDIMHPNRQPKTLHGDAFNHYDTLYENYNSCNHQLKINYHLEPYRYTQGLTEKRLKATKNIKICYANAWQTQQDLQGQGKSYQHHARDYAQSYYYYTNCVDNVLREIPEPHDMTHVTLNTTKITPEEIDYRLSEMDDEDYDVYDKYRGISGWFLAYKDMKNDQNAIKTPNQSDETSTGRFGFYNTIISSVLDHAKNTPEQLHAKNLYQYNNSQIISLSHHQPSQRQARFWWSFDFRSPTAHQSIQLPLHMNFSTGTATADISAMLPLLAVIDPKDAPLPSDIKDGKVSFALPTNLHQQLPSTVIYDAIINGLIEGYRSLPNDKFVATDISSDKFAKEIGAKHAIKLDLNNKEVGQLYAIIVKHIVKDLKHYADKHPQYYPDSTASLDTSKEGSEQATIQAHKIKQLIDDFTILNQGYQSGDVGGLFQVIEGILPISFDGASHLYLNSTGKLIGIQNITSINSAIQNARTQSVNQIRYDKALFDKHALKANFYQDLTGDAFDGSAWLQERWLDYQLKKEATYARYEYSYSASEAALEAAKASEAALAEVVSEDLSDDAQKTAEEFYKKERSTQAQ